MALDFSWCFSSELPPAILADKIDNRRLLIATPGVRIHRRQTEIGTLLMDADSGTPPFHALAR